MVKKCVVQHSLVQPRCKAVEKVYASFLLGRPVVDTDWSISADLQCLKIIWRKEGLVLSCGNFS